MMENQFIHHMFYKPSLGSVFSGGALGIWGRVGGLFGRFRWEKQVERKIALKIALKNSVEK